MVRGSKKRGRAGEVDEVEGTRAGKRGRVLQREMEEEEYEGQDGDEEGSGDEERSADGEDGDAYPESQQIRSMVDATLKATSDRNTFLRNFRRTVERDREALSRELDSVRVDALTATKAMDTMRNLVSSCLPAGPPQADSATATGAQKASSHSLSDTADLLIDRSHDLLDMYETLTAELEARQTARLAKLKESWTSDREAVSSLLEKGRNVSVRRVQSVLPPDSRAECEAPLDGADEADAAVQKIFPRREGAEESEGAVRSVLRGMARGVARMVRDLPV